jgi:hypothetical protein
VRQRAAEASGEPVTARHALVVIDVPRALVGANAAGTTPRRGSLDRALLMARLADHARLVFSADETIGEAAPSRLLVLAARSTDLGFRVAVLKDLVADVTPLGGGVRIWIEGVPSSNAATAALLDELART